MRKFKTVEGEYYHIYHRGNNKQDIFYDVRDMARFLFLVMCLQSPKSFDHIHRIINSIVQSSVLAYEKYFTFGILEGVKMYLKKIKKLPKRRKAPKGIGRKNEGSWRKDL